MRICRSTSLRSHFKRKKNHKPPISTEELAAHRHAASDISECLSFFLFQLVFEAQGKSPGCLSLNKESNKVCPMAWLHLILCLMPLSFPSWPPQEAMDYSPPGSSVHCILQARILEWVAMASSRGIFLTQGWIFTATLWGYLMKELMVKTWRCLERCRKQSWGSRLLGSWIQCSFQNTLLLPLDVQKATELIVDRKEGL